MTDTAVVVARGMGRAGAPSRGEGAGSRYLKEGANLAGANLSHATLTGVD